MNLDKRGIYLNFTRCPICDEDQEMELDLFAYFRVAKDLWNVSCWWLIGDFDLHCINDNLAMPINTTLSKHYRYCFDPVIHTVLWTF